MKLNELTHDNKAIISELKGGATIKKRISEMGFVKGREVTRIKSAPLQDPVEYDILGYRVLLRNSEAALIEVLPPELATNIKPPMVAAGTTEKMLKKVGLEAGKFIEVALVGNPNAGKTTLFNHITHSKEHVGNYSGVTVEAKEARFKQAGYTFNIVDLPGTYSLTPYSPEELYVRHYINREMPDVIVNVVDATNLERNLYLTTQLIDMDVKVVLALNMYDELERSGDVLDYSALGEMIGIPIVPTVATSGKGLESLLAKVIEVYADNDEVSRQVHVNYGPEIEKSIKAVQHHIWDDPSLAFDMPSRFIAIKLFEGDLDMEERVAAYNGGSVILTEGQKQRNRLKTCYNEDPGTLVTDTKYGFIAGALKMTLRKGPQERYNQTQLIDNVLTHRIVGFPVFVAVLWLMFYTTFSVGQYPMGLIEEGVGLLQLLVSNYLQDGMLKDLLMDGVLSGVGGVIVFLPNILIMFLFITLMEDTGYMARAAFLTDKLMHKVGLHGKSFIPLIMGFGCNVPAIMAARTLENRKDRILTILINPFMSCSARLPVYVLITGTFFPQHAGLVLTSVYGIGIGLAIVVAYVINRLWKNTKSMPFVMELPPYRVPTLRTVLGHLWFKAAQYLKKMGGVILAASVLIWALGYFPQEVSFSKDYDRLLSQANSRYKAGYITQKQFDLEVHTVNAQQAGEKIEQSFIGQFGKFMDPVMQPLGFDWKMSVALITGAAAKEIIISTMAVLYQADDMAYDNQLAHKLKIAKHASGSWAGKPVFSTAVAFAFLMFVLVYFPCIAVIAGIRKETGSWKWAAFVALYTTALAWLFAFLVFQLFG